MTNLNSETTSYLQKMDYVNKYFFKIFKELLILNSVIFFIFITVLFFIMPSFKSAIIFIIPFLIILFLNSIVLIIYRFTNCSKIKHDLIVKNFSESTRVIQDIDNNYRHHPEIKYLIEVLLAGCDINDQDDFNKIIRLTNLIKIDIANEKE